MINFALTLRLSVVPLLIYVMFAWVRLLGVQPEMEAEPGDFITASFFLFGASVAYLAFVGFQIYGQHMLVRRGGWWWCMSFLLIMIAVDEIFMVHEQIGSALGVKDTYILLGYAAALGVLLLIRFFFALSRPTIYFLFLFGLLNAVALVSDAMYNEGVMLIFGREISYEQMSESFGAMFLCCAIISMALSDLKSIFSSNSTVSS